jgi:hypothetical protein
MPLFEYECDSCIEEYNSDISSVVEKLNKTNATKIMKKNPKFCYIEAYDDKRHKKIFELGEKGKYNKYSIRKFRYNLKNNKILYIELRNYKFSELIYNKEEEKNLKCPLCNKSSKVRRVYSTFRAILDDKNKRAPRPGDELAYHFDYKKQKDEEMASSWVGYDYLNQYFND